ncbi:glucuronate isomerase [Neobacillus sp. 19]|uniref:glucuronate isomerase n=1 Tax=Neobacillus sp. 19 TaxID=3394458 RepID=UPI003BF6D8E8
MDQHFLLNSETAVKLYENAASKAPIFDFHCHLNPQEVWVKRRTKNAKAFHDKCENAYCRLLGST